MKITKILSETFWLLKSNLYCLVQATGIYILFATAIETVLQISLPTSGGLLVSCLVSVAGMALSAVITLAGLRYFFETREKPLAITGRKVMIYIVAALFVSVATTLGVMALVIPGIIVASISILYPVYILRYGDGPLNAVEKSIDAVKGNIPVLCVASCIFYLSLTLLSLVIFYLLALYPVDVMIVDIVDSAVHYLINLPVICFTYAVYQAVFEADPDKEAGKQEESDCT